MTRRVALVGIDGCGKTSVIARIRQQTGSSPTRLHTVHCPDFHDACNGPFESLSRHLKKMSRLADAVGNPGVKAAVLYLRMTLYGPVEKFWIDTYRPELLLCERHPLVETYVYAPLYSTLARTLTLDAQDELDRFVRTAGETEDEAFRAMQAWQGAEQRRTGLGEDLTEILPAIVDLLAKPPEQAEPLLDALYRTTLPDLVIWLDCPVEDAFARCRARADLEVHETFASLTALRTRYAELHTVLSRTRSAPEVVRVETSRSEELDSVVSRCLQLIETAHRSSDIFVPRAMSDRSIGVPTDVSPAIAT